jgi:hypothetical protein
VKRVHFLRALIARQKMMRRKAGEYTPTEVGIVAWIAELVCKSNIFHGNYSIAHTPFVPICRRRSSRQSLAVSTTTQTCLCMGVCVDHKSA